MKKSIVLLCLIFGGLSLSSAQEKVATPAQIAAFFKTKTLVVLEENMFSEYNSYIQTAMKKHWRLTPYEFISESDFQKKRFDPSFSFLARTHVVFAGDKTGAHYYFLSLLLGDANSTTSVSQMPDLCSFPICYKDADPARYLYKLSPLVNFIQQHVELTRDNPDLTKDNVIKYYNKNMTAVSDKTLYVVLDELSPKVNNSSKIKELYPFSVKIVTLDKLEEIIESGEEDAVFFHVVMPEKQHEKARCWKLAMGVTDGKLYYFDYHMIKKDADIGVLDTDFKNIRKL